MKGPWVQPPQPPQQLEAGALRVGRSPKGPMELPAASSPLAPVPRLCPQPAQGSHLGKTTSGFCFDKGNKNSRRLVRGRERRRERGGTEWCQRQSFPAAGTEAGRRGKTRGKRSGVAQSKPAGCEGAAGRRRALPSIWGCPVGQPRPAARGLACPGQHRSGRETREQAGAHSTPALLTDTMPPGVGTTVIPFDRWEN